MNRETSHLLNLAAFLACIVGMILSMLSNFQSYDWIWPLTAAVWILSHEQREVLIQNLETQIKTLKTEER